MIIKNKRGGMHLDIVVLVILVLLVCISTLYMAYMTEIRRGVAFGGVENLYEIEMNRNDANFYLQMASEESLIKTYQDFLNNKTALVSNDFNWFIEKYKFNLKSVLTGYSLPEKYSSIVGLVDSSRVEFDGQKINLVISNWETRTVPSTDLDATFSGELSYANELRNFGLNSTEEMGTVYSACASSENRLDCFNSKLNDYNIVGSVFTSKKDFFYGLKKQPILFVWN